MVNIKCLGLEINHLNWKNPIDHMITKLSGAFYAVRLMFHIALLIKNQFILPILMVCPTVKRYLLYIRKLLEFWCMQTL